MKIMTFQEIQSKTLEIKEEITNRLKCDVEEFEIVHHESGKVSIHWDIVARHIFSYTSIPHGWIVGSVDWRESRLSMYASPEYFLMFNS